MKTVHPFYRPLATLLRAGLTLEQALESMESTMPTRRWRAVVQQVRAELAGGARFYEALAGRPDCFDRFQRAITQAGEETGHLEEAFEKLAHVLELEAQLRNQFIYNLFYPIFLLHAAVLLPTLSIIVKDGVAAYLQTNLPIIGAGWGVAIGGWLMVRVFSKFPLTAGFWDEFKINFPFIGSITRNFAWSRLLWVLEACDAAGIKFSQSLVLAGQACRNKVFAARFRRAAGALEQGATLSEAIAKHTGCPKTLLAMIHTGETGGRLEEMLGRGARLCQDQGEERLRRLMKTLPVLIYLGAAAYVAYTVIQFYGAYFTQLREIE